MANLQFHLAKDTAESILILNIFEDSKSCAETLSSVKQGPRGEEIIDEKKSEVKNIVRLSFTNEAAGTVARIGQFYAWWNRRWSGRYQISGQRSCVEVYTGSLVVFIVVTPEEQQF